ncbi:MAG TPA: carboxypeptidase-like regulatory domain-containing protein [Ramlibacter sp.]|nr:carboxypeptidase-like regulatory domain-containing protein [Ramlibacter sp.]
MRFKNNVAAALAICTIATAAYALPDIKIAGNVEYMTGGIGSEESSQMQAQARRWPLALEFATRAGDQAHWLANIDVTVIDHRGTTVLQATSDGPLLLARLRPGNYTVRASADGKVLQRKVHIAPGESARSVFVWPQQTATG